MTSTTTIQVKWQVTLGALAAISCNSALADSMPIGPPDQASAGSPAVSAALQSDATDVEQNGCEADAYEDRTEDGAERVIAIARDGLTFTPKCMTLAAGQSVVWEGNLSAHPLAPGNPSDERAGSPDNPIEPTSSGDSVEFRFEKPGIYPYYCSVHAFGTGQGMAGVVQVL